MRVQLDQVREHPVTWTEEVAVEASDLDDEGVLSLGPVRCSGEIERAEGLTERGSEGAEQGFVLRVHLDYPQTLTCFRCLEPTEQEVTHDFEILLLADLGGDEPTELELDETDLDVLRVSGDELDTEPLVFEQVRLNLPMKPLCSADCKGLCPTCGADLNAGPCQCPAPAPDARWSGLAALRDRLPSATKDDPASD